MRIRSVSDFVVIARPVFNRGTRERVGMQISFHHTNPAASHDSTLLKITPGNKDPYWYLIDAGESV
jgi:hypothetical protein